jgi:Domain of unknown function (DUF4265)
MAKVLVKLRFELDPADWHGAGGEFMWAAPAGRDVTGSRRFQIRNSPFHARDISFKDIVQATPTEQARVFEFEQVIERSGHSTYMLLVEPDHPEFKVRWNTLKDMGCSHESATINMNIGRRVLYSIDVPPSANVHEVYRLLERGELDAIWSFQEGYAHLPEKPASPG